MNRKIKDFLFIKKIKIIFIFLVFLPFLILIFQGKMIFWGTASLQFIPWDQYLYDNILSGYFPLWNPYNGMGVPFMANHQSAVFYPLNVLIFIGYLLFNLPGLITVMTLLIPIHLIIAGLGIMKIVGSFGKSEFAQLISAIFFSFCGYILTRLSFISMVWTFAWLPWIVYACIQLKISKAKIPLAEITQLTIFIALQLLAGHAQTSFYTIMLGGLFLLFFDLLNLRETITKIGYYVAANVLALLISAIQIIPTGEFLLQSQRSNEVGFEYATNFSLWPGRLISIIYGNFWGNPNQGRFLSGGNFWEENIYIGVFPFLFVIILSWHLLWKTRKHEIEQKQKNNIIFLGILLLFSIFFALGKFFFFFPFLYSNVPGFNLFQGPSRLLIYYFFITSLFIAYGIDFWFVSKYNVRKTIIIIIVFGMLLAISIGLSVYKSNFPKPMINSLLFGNILGLFFGLLTFFKDKLSIKRLVLQFVLMTVIILDLLPHNFFFENFLPIKYYAEINSTPKPNALDRVFISQEDEEFLKFNTFFRTDRLQPLFDYTEGNLLLLPNQNLFNNRYAMINNFDPLQPQRFSIFWEWLNHLSSAQLKNILSMIGVDTIIKLSPSVPSSVYKAQIPSKGIVQWYGCRLFVNQDQALNNLLLLEEVSPDSRCLILEEGSLSKDNINSSSIKPEYLEYQYLNPDLLLIKYSAAEPGWIVVRQNDYSGWQATLDNERNIPINKADFLFQGLYVPAGEHEIVLQFKPVSLRLGILGSVTGILLLISLNIYFHLRKRPKA